MAMCTLSPTTSGTLGYAFARITDTDVPSFTFEPTSGERRRTVPGGSCEKCLPDAPSRTNPAFLNFFAAAFPLSPITSGITTFLILTCGLGGMGEIVAEGDTTTVPEGGRVCAVQLGVEVVITRVTASAMATAQTSCFETHAAGAPGVFMRGAMIVGAPRSLARNVCVTSRTSTSPDKIVRWAGLGINNVGIRPVAFLSAGAGTDSQR